jgi:DNA-binding transcriptional LysR family regulator
VPVDSLDLRSALLEAKVDLVIGGIAQLVEEHRHQDLFSESFVCIARQGHPGIHGSLTLQAFAELRHVGIAARTSHMSRIDEICKTMGFMRRLDVVVPNFLSIPFIVAATDCIATMPRRLLRMAPPQLGLQVFAAPIELPTPVIRQFWPERAHQDAVCRWVRGQIRQVCQGL